MKVRASVKKRSVKGDKREFIVHRKPRGGRGPGRVYVINKLKRRHNQRQG